MKYRLRLYVTGASAHSTAAMENLERICASGCRAATSWR